ncbi:salicylate 1-monooxygenase [Streptomyces pristinaespiralis ATCC 25486]|uniref:Salicylate 1-monooxygenase n=3 Tax=Streptomyces pristinaespiralis TaxID=38300 RepID=B5HJQ2_STRE2|nr:salicylate 1-monooxygenase [Streptomyces pristinaespiralis]EDY67064.1 salicylate 1-monooxygenase [Streptomyces pristinaespiralis ATCC 25486]
MGFGEVGGMRRPRITVVGAGIGGLTLAGALAANGTDYVIHEQTRRLAEVGAGVQLSPNAVRPLLRLGLGDALREHAVRIDAMEVRGWTGRPVARTPLGEECERMFGAPYYSIHRAHLHEALLSLVDRDRLRLGELLRGARETDTGGVRLTFEDGTVRDAGVVVGADGIHSTVREAFVRDEPVFAGLGIYRGLVPADRLPDAARERLVRLWLGPGGHFVCYPVAAGEYLSFAATVPMDEAPAESWSAPGDPEDLRRAFGSWTGLVSDIVEATEVTHQWALHDRPPLRTWSSRRITLLGDAAHPMLPFMAQGAGQAIEDAMDLAACLTDAPEERIADSLARYEALRIPRTAEIQRGSRGNAGVLHLPDGPAQRRRDARMAVHASLRDRATLYAHETGRSVVAAAV